MDHRAELTASLDALDRGFWGFADSMEVRHYDRVVVSGQDTGGERDSVQPEDDSTASESHPRGMGRARLSDSAGEDDGIGVAMAERATLHRQGVEPVYDTPVRPENGGMQPGGRPQPYLESKKTKKSKVLRLRGLALSTRGAPVKKPYGQKPVVGHRKRRSSGRILRAPQHLPSVSEGDMTQADEMGDAGQDDGFVEGLDDQTKKKMRRKGGVAVGNGPSSDAEGAQQLDRGGNPINKLRRMLVTRSFHQVALRDPQRRPKPRQRRPKSNFFVSADASAPDTTTPAPYSSDTHEEVDSSAGGESPDCPHKSDHLYEDLNWQEEEITQMNSSNPSKAMAQMNGERLADGKVCSPPEDDAGHYALLNPIGMEELSPSQCAALKGTDESQGNSSAVTSDTEYGGKQAGKRKKKPWKPNSDMSTTTGPHSTETSDVDTSANEQSSEVTPKGKQKRSLSTLFFGLTFGLKNKEKSKDKAKDKAKSKTMDKGDAERSKSRFSASAPGTLKKPRSEPHLAEAKEPEDPPARAAITPDPKRSSKLDAEMQLPDPDATTQAQGSPQQQSVGGKADAVNSDSVPSTQSSTSSTPRASKVRTIQERIAILQQQGVRTESDSDGQGVLERPAHSPVPLPHQQAKLTTADGPPEAKSRIMKTIQMFEGHSTHSSGEAQPRKSLGQDVDAGPKKVEPSDRKSSNSSSNSSDTSVSEPVKPLASPQTQPKRKPEEIPKPTASVENSASLASPPVVQEPSLEITVKSPSGGEDLQPPAVPLRHPRGPCSPSEDEEEMKLFAKLQAAAARARKEPPAVPAPYRDGKKGLGAERSQQTLPLNSSQKERGSRSAYTLPTEKRGTGSRTPSPPHLPPPRSAYSPAAKLQTSSEADQDQDSIPGAAARPKVIPSSIEIDPDQQSSNSLSRSEPNLLDGPSTPPAIPARQESKDLLERSNGSPYRSLGRHVAANILNRAASVDSCLDERSSKSVSPPQVLSGRETTPGLPTLGDDLSSFMDDALTKSFSSTDGLAAQLEEHNDGVCESHNNEEERMHRTLSKKPARTKSERTLKRHSVGALLESSVTDERARVRRTPSMDVLNSRTDRQSRHFFESSSDDEDEGDQAEKESDVTKEDKPVPVKPPSGMSGIESLRSSVGSLNPPVLELEDGEEPLYQYVNYAQLQKSTLPYKSNGEPSNATAMHRMSMYETLGRKDSYAAIPGLGALRVKLWRDLEEVQASGCLEDLLEVEIQTQETYYELFLTEASYGRSLDVLLAEYVEDPLFNPHSNTSDNCLISRRDFQVLFSNVRECREVSRSFYSALEERRGESVVCKNVCDIIMDYATSHFNCYVRYISNQRYQEQTLNRLMLENPAFKEFCVQKGKSRSCQGLSLISFLLLPMQRITRMPLLVLAILNRMHYEDPERDLVERTLKTVQELVAECNDGAKRLERTEQLVAIHRQIHFGKLKPLPLVSASRHLVKKGRVIELKQQDNLFGRTSTQRRPVQLFSFNDLVIVCKKKKAYSMPRLGANRMDVFSVVDYGEKSVVHCEHVPCHPNVTFPKNFEDTMDGDHMLALWTVSQAKAKFAFFFTILENCESKRASYVCLAQNETEMVRWIDALNPPAADQSGNTTYELWDHPQYQTMFDYFPSQPDELCLMAGDVIRVFKKMVDGWYYGENMRNLECGWFPSNYTFEMNTEHKRRKNLRQEYQRLSHHNMKNISLHPESAVAMGVGLGEVNC